MVYLKKTCSPRGRTPGRLQNPGSLWLSFSVSTSRHRNAMIIHWHGGCGEQAFVVDLRVGDAFFSSPPSPPSPNDASWQHGRGNLRRERASIGSQSRVKELQPILRRRRRERRKYTAVVWVLVSCAYTVTGSLTLSSSSVRPSVPPCRDDQESRDS